MKIVCEHCGAKYQIPEEKVQGRIFKFNCNKCDEVIQVDNSSAAGGGFDDAADWYIVVDDEQVGPITASQIGEYISSGRFSAAGYVWKEGFPDWLPLHDVDELAALNIESLSASSVYYSEEDSAVGEPAQDPYGSSGFDQSSYQSEQPSYDTQSSQQDYSAGSFSSSFGDAASPYSQDQGGFQSAGSFDPADQGGAFASFASTSGPAPSSTESSGGLFAAFDNASSSSASSNFASSSAPSGLVGQRSESSVLFSLSSLQQVSSQTQAKESSKGPVTEGSGLIDLQALASAHSALGSSDDADDPFASSSMALPPLAPMGSHKSNTPLIIGATVGGLLLLALLGVVIYLLQSKPPEQPVVQQPVQQKVIERVIVRENPVEKEEEKEAAAAGEKAKKIAAANKKKAAEAAADKEDDNDKEVAQKDDDSSSDDDDKSGSKSGRRRRDDDDDKRHNSRPSSSSSRGSSNSKKKDDNGIRDVLDNIGSKSKPDNKPAPAPQGLTRNQVLDTIRKYIPRISSCARSANSRHLSGRMLIKFNIRPNGSVIGTTVATPKFAGTDVANCASRVVSGMKFPSSSASANIPISYPFDI